ncbi:unnamed protein product [Cunninghamella echinulata]
MQEIIYLHVTIRSSFKFSKRCGDTLLKTTLIRHMLRYHRKVDLSNTRITHKGVLFIIINIKEITKIVVRHCSILETELVRRIMASKQYDISVEIELPLNNRKPIYNMHVVALYNRFPGIKIYRWFCNKHPLEIVKYHQFTPNDLDVTICHECFETTHNRYFMACGICRMISCDKCYYHEERYCLGCS